ncbi:hypothetical protein Aple_019930 [Acrocarpospora pleiomorpha]|uniref:ChsH2 C-terminal OB-fold domain-containing protein n=1 Tax=Acrocarpospora pleiomorpha TaxID=90975 RepID=A0A5M3XBM2_9ACTN|nr:OB-fold domain-containing protein [Acrocarpospora pleiomorpha]GES19097.1 hypothetical protein Aple_019930 [Acrocarpospora pleiomorpha]
MSRAALPVPAATITPGLEPYWRALADGELRLPYSRKTGEVLWYPRVGGDLEVEWRAATGRGVVYSATVVRRPAGPYRDSGPYALAYVTLAEGPRLLTHVVGVPPAEVRIGMRVRAAIETGADGAVILRFRPDDGSES